MMYYFQWAEILTATIKVLNEIIVVLGEMVLAKIEGDSLSESANEFELVCLIIHNFTLLPLLIG